MSKLRDMILKRRDELRSELDALLKELKQAELALAALEGSAKGPVRSQEHVVVNRRYFMPPSATAVTRSPGDGLSYANDGLDQMTIKKMIVSVLEPLLPGIGLTAPEIIERIRDSFGKDIERTSLSPQLSRLKGDEIIEAFENTWFMRGRAPKGATQSISVKETPSTEKLGEGFFR